MFLLVAGVAIGYLGLRKLLAHIKGPDPIPLDPED